MKKSNLKPTQGEMEILEVLWKTGAASVRQVHDLLNKIPDRKQKGYTTTLKFMQNMCEKGLLTREEQGNKHLYEPTISEKDNVQKRLDKIVEKTFHGSAMKLVMQILGNNKSSKEELNEIRDYLDQLDQDDK